MTRLCRVGWNYIRIGWNYIFIGYLYLRMLFLKGSFKVLDHTLSWFYFVWCKTPWFRAYAFAAFEEYTKTTLYRDRLIALGKEFALEAYLGEGATIGDRSHFKQKVRKNKKLMFKIIFAPYSVEVMEVS